jgi:hypothetical protein
MVDLPAGLRAWAGLAGPERVLDQVRLRAGRGHGTETGTLRLELEQPHRREVARLLGTRWDVSGRPVRLQDLATALAEHGLTVRGFVEALDGRPLVAQRQLRAEEDARAASELAAASDLLVGAGIDAGVVAAWLDDPGLPRAGAGRLLRLAERTATVCARLPGSSGPVVRLAQLAAALFDNAHALDYRQDLGRAAARLVATVHGLPRPARAGRDWRRAWAAATRCRPGCSPSICR